MRSALAALALLAACAPAAPPTATWRDPAVTLASRAGLDPARLDGRWHEVGRFPDGGCAGGTVDYRAGAGGILAIEETCGGRTMRGVARPSGPGRFAVTRGGRGSEEWVLWLDDDARTLVLAAPDGTGGRILDRDPRSSPDRLRAALTVLDFNGFDAGALRLAPSVDTLGPAD